MCYKVGKSIQGSLIYDRAKEEKQDAVKQPIFPLKGFEFLNYPFREFYQSCFQMQPFHNETPHKGTYDNDL